LTKSRLSRGFHRFALFLAAITLVIGGSISVFLALNPAGSVPQIVIPDCHDNSDDCRAMWAPINDQVQKEGWVAVLEKAQKRPATSFGSGLMTLALTLAVYGLVRAIGWLIGGLAGL
jgi:hypothetical protein